MAAFDPLIEAQLDGKTIRATSLVHLDFKSGPQRLWPGFGPVTIAGLTYQGIGNLGRLSAISGGPGGAVSEVTCEVSGDASILSDIEGDSEESIGRDMEVLLAFFEVRRFDEAGNWIDWNPIPPPISLFVGRMGPLTVKRQAAQGGAGGASRVVSLPCQNIMVNRARPSQQFFTDPDQKARAPTDNIFLRVSQYSEGSVRWPLF